MRNMAVSDEKSQNDGLRRLQPLEACGDAVTTGEGTNWKLMECHGTKSAVTHKCASSSL